VALAVGTLAVALASAGVGVVVGIWLVGSGRVLVQRHPAQYGAS
jgi:hypothetical protein